MKRGFLLVVILLVLTSFALAQEDTTYHLKLLAVQDMNHNLTGSDADLFLELKEGTGRVFLDTFPVTRMDTQISTRFAKEIACKHFKLDCNQYDFIYTIKAKSNIIGGPSAGAAIAALTTIAVLDLEYDNTVSITGTVNSGGTIGPVGGVSEKVAAGVVAGLTKVLVPQGATQNTSLEQEFNSSNQNSSNKNTTSPTTFLENNLTLLNQNPALDVIEVANLDEVLFEFTGVDLNHKNITIAENQEYSSIMQELNNVLCTRTHKILQELEDQETQLNDEQSSLTTTALDRAKNASEQGDYYSAASFCFGANINLREQFYTLKETSPLSITKQFSLLQEKVNSAQQLLLQEPIETISDLQAFMVVSERLQDVQHQINVFSELNNSDVHSQYRLLAYAEERYFSALAWMKFFNMEGKKFIMNQEFLAASCLTKISEAEQRQQYTELFVPAQHVQYLQEKIEAAAIAHNSAQYALCLITASQAKADANAVLSTIGVSQSVVDQFIESKKKAVELVITENSAEGIFPILGYSYYQYAQSLQESDARSALLYLEYALEMSELGMYFPEDKDPLEIFLETKFTSKQKAGLQGFIAGVLLTLALVWWKKRK